MTYQVLARKWRPKDFASLVGQEHVVRALTHALQAQRLHHAYLFTGTRGVGKTTLSRILAKALNCETGITATPCGVCTACREIDEGRFVDYVEMDAASNRGVDEMAALLERAVYAPVDARFKVYMIDEVHMLTNHAFNSMLKTLEEPPAHVKFILATTDPQKIPVTVLSRCLQFNLKQMPAGHIVSHLEHILAQEGIGFETQALRLLSRAADGSMRDALSLTDQAIAYAAGEVTEEAVRGMLGALDQSYLVRLLDAVAAHDGAAVLAIADEMASRSLSFSTALQDLSGLLHRIAWAQFAPGSVLDEWPEAADIRRFAAQLAPEAVQLYYQIATIGRSELGLAPDEYAGFTMTLLRMLAFRAADGVSVPVPAAAAPDGGASGAGGAQGGGGTGGVSRDFAGSAAAPAGTQAEAPRAAFGAPASGGTPPAPSFAGPSESAAVHARAQAATTAQSGAASAEAVPQTASEASPQRAQPRVRANLPAHPAEPERAPEPVDASPQAAPAADAAAAPGADAVAEPSQAAFATGDDAGGTGRDTAPEAAPQRAAPLRGASPASAALGVLREKGLRLSSDRGRTAEPALASRAPAAAQGDGVAAAKSDKPESVKAAAKLAERLAANAASGARRAPRGAAAAETAAGIGSSGGGATASSAQASTRAGTSPSGAAAVPPWEDMPPDDAYLPLSAYDASFEPSEQDFARDMPPAFESSRARGASAAAAAAVDTTPLPPAVSLAPLGYGEDWPTLAASLPLTGIAYQLAFNSELTACEGDELTLRVPVPQYADAAQVAKLKAALDAKLGTPVRLSVSVGPARRTAAAAEAAARARRQQEAEREIEADPFVRTLIREFDATIVPGSIRPLSTGNGACAA